ncbi:MAG: hypothetical protein M3Q07_26180, partial [Pseudobdellovibrionaceae bacterium]|nr:hypothetical protein [Pseudobdellovibrionaceae bacterium]
MSDFILESGVTLNCGYRKGDLEIYAKISSRVDKYISMTFVVSDAGLSFDSGNITVGPFSELATRLFDLGYVAYHSKIDRKYYHFSVRGGNSVSDEDASKVIKLSVGGA